MRKLLTILLPALALTACTDEQPQPQPEGVYVEIALDNEQGLNSYVLRNPNISTIEECEASMKDALPAIMANLPPQVPRDSKATGWKCSLTDPRKS